MEPEGPGRVWDPSVYELQEGEELDYDPTAYKCMHEMGVEWPCLSFDLIPDSLGFMRRTWPQTLYMVAGTQAADPSANRLVVMKERQSQGARRVCADSLFSRCRI